MATYRVIVSLEIEADDVRSGEVAAGAVTTLPAPTTARPCSRRWKRWRARSTSR